jgi:hypothetical protein
VQAGSVQLLASVLQVPPCAAQVAASQAGVVQTPALQVPPAAWQLSGAQVLTQVSPMQAPPAA